MPRSDLASFALLALGPWGFALLSHSFDAWTPDGGELARLVAATVATLGLGVLYAVTYRRAVRHAGRRTLCSATDLAVVGVDLALLPIPLPYNEAFGVGAVVVALAGLAFGRRPDGSATDRDESMPAPDVVFYLAAPICLAIMALLANPFGETVADDLARSRLLLAAAVTAVIGAVYVTAYGRALRYFTTKGLDTTGVFLILGACMTVLPIPTDDHVAIGVIWILMAFVLLVFRRRPKHERYEYERRRAG